jgi:hypothetical protein
MNAKLFLSPDDLAVESFTPHADSRAAPGTVHACEDTDVACDTGATGCAGSTCPVWWCDPWTGGETGDVTRFGPRCDPVTRVC